MGAADFYMYNGSVQGIPNAADIKDYVFLNINETNADKTWAIFDQQTNQIRWHYCSALSDEPDLYVDVSLDDWSWTVGTLDRTTGCLYQEDIKTTLLVDHDGYIFQHGTGRDADTAALESYITYGLYAIGDGSANVDVMGVIPDTQRQTGNLSYEVYTKERPNSASNFDSQTLTVTPTTEIADSRVSGRHFGMTVRSNVVGGDFRLGIPKLEIGPSGDKR
jgi:hypothetical protein